ncbi:alpha/beta fold hydrolase [Sabulicella glaciei]|uniref:Alpha/beta hydrolase n=1 Tax=Sabulicella glaciei TaxID=2984948 RepID=A0ABT3NZ61_9PROT|nr:alpha/beta hydrolase [Roseococcus sp. MDT2-1-1]MCW8087418.1 alpha/beta hydrolase [Roseococcus sp. MDT2-1-1]
MMHALVSTERVPAGLLPVVLVHGLGMSSRYMAPLARCLARDAFVLAPDLPGFGLSDDPPRALTVPGMADALAAWMDEAGLSRAALVANSLGCEVVVELAMQRPDLVARAVLQGPTPDREHASAIRQLAMFFLTSLFENPGIIWVALTDYLRAGVRRYVQTFRHMHGYSLSAKLPYVAAPALIVRGARDYLVPQGWVERMVRLMPNASLVVMPSVAHGMNYSHPAELRAAILPFLLGSGPPADHSV